MLLLMLPLLESIEVDRDQPAGFVERTTTFLVIDYSGSLLLFSQQCVDYVLID